MTLTTSSNAGFELQEEKKVEPFDFSLLHLPRTQTAFISSPPPASPSLPPIPFPSPFFLRTSKPCGSPEHAGMEPMNVSDFLYARCGKRKRRREGKEL